jgi:hypothetical protein
MQPVAVNDHEERNRVAKELIGRALRMYKYHRKWEKMESTMTEAENKGHAIYFLKEQELLYELVNGEVTSGKFYNGHLFALRTMLKARIECTTKPEIRRLAAILKEFDAPTYELPEYLPNDVRKKINSYAWGEYMPNGVQSKIERYATGNYSRWPKTKA